MMCMYVLLGGCLSILFGVDGEGLVSVNEWLVMWW